MKALQELIENSKGFDEQKADFDDKPGSFSFSDDGKIVMPKMVGG